MLAYVLAWVVGLGSLTVYLAAFFFPEVHRKNDFIWSGIGFFYALVLWVYAERLRGGILLGQAASVALLVFFGWQTLSLRRQLTPSDQQTRPDAEAVQTKVGGLKSNLQRRLANLPIRNTPQASQAAPRAEQAQQAPSSPASQKQPDQAVPTAAAPAAESKAPPLPETASKTESIEIPQSKPIAVSPLSKAKPESTQKKTQLQLVKLQAIATQLVATIKNQIQQRLPGSKSARPTPAKSNSQAEAKTTKPVAPAPESTTATTDSVSQPDSETQVTELETGTQEPIPIEDIAPEVDLAPPAEDVSARDVELSAAVEPSIEAIDADRSLDAMPTKVEPTEPLEDQTPEDHPKLVRPHRPNPELLDAARRAAEAKSPGKDPGGEDPSGSS